MSRAVVRRGAVCALAWLAVVAGMSAPAAATDVRVRPALFGVHDRTGASYVTVHPGSVRLWDIGVRWYEVETTEGTYDWTHLDQLVAAAQAAHAEATMVVAMTPSFYADTRTDPPRRLAPYKRFVTALMTRYRDFEGSRGISAYQVWGEVNISTFWTGTVREIARLTRTVDRVRDSVDPDAKVIAPAMVTRLDFELDGLSAYYGYRLDGVPVWKYVDAVSLSLYPLPRYGARAGVPEDGIRLLKQVRKRLRLAGVPEAMPIWNTEVNYGLKSGAQGGTPATPVSDARQASAVARTYLLNAAAGVKRVFWYRYDMGRYSTGGSIANTLLSTPYQWDQATPAGGAYALVQSWMHGTLLGTKGHRPCARDSHGTYMCVVKDSTVTRRIYWNPFHRATVRLAAGARKAQDVLGFTWKAKGGSKLRVTYEPVMVRH